MPDREQRELQRWLEVEQKGRRMAWSDLLPAQSAKTRCKFVRRARRNKVGKG